MNVAEIIRLEEDFQLGTFGVIRVNKRRFSDTLEPSDRLNQTNVSSIPAQQYICVPFNSPKFGRVYKVTHVPGRTNILFHPGNRLKDTLGCIMLGVMGYLDDERAILKSRITYDRFHKIMNNDPFHLTIHEFY